MSELTADTLDQIEAVITRLEAMVADLPGGTTPIGSADLEARRVLAKLTGNHRRLVELVKGQTDAFAEMARLLKDLTVRVEQLEHVPECPCVPPS